MLNDKENDKVGSRAAAAQDGAQLAETAKELAFAASPAPREED